MTKKEKIQEYGEVFTPNHIVNEMCDMMEESNPDIFMPNKTFLEPFCGDGAFIIEILRRKFQYCKSKEDYMISVKSIYGFEIQQDNVDKCIENVIKFCSQYFKVTKNDIETISNHIILCDGLKIMTMLADMKEG